MKVSETFKVYTTKTQITDRVEPGLIFTTFHFAESAANSKRTFFVRPNPVLDPVAKIPEFKVCAVKVEKA